MRSILISTVLAVSVLASAPAAAQYRGDHRSDYGYRSGAGIEREIDEIKRRIDRARDNRSLSREEARRLVAQNVPGASGAADHGEFECVLNDQRRPPPGFIFTQVDHIYVTGR